MKISCIIPAYNEEASIASVLKVVSACPMVNEVIVIDDGSKDNTAKIVRTSFSGINLVVHEKNKGKSAAILNGANKAQGDFLILIDADLIGLKKADIEKLIAPISAGHAEVSLSLRKNAPWVWRIIGIDFISGERVIPKKIIVGNAKDISKLPGYGLEVFINSLIIKNNYRIEIVSWPGVESPYKYKKYGLWKGIKSDSKMIFDIFKSVSVFSPIYQIIKLRKMSLHK